MAGEFMTAHDFVGRQHERLDEFNNATARAKDASGRDFFITNLNEAIKHTCADALIGRPQVDTRQLAEYVVDFILSSPQGPH